MALQNNAIHALTFFQVADPIYILLLEPLRPGSAAAMENLRDISSGKQKHCKLITIQSNVKKVRIGCIGKTEEINAYRHTCFW
jgi:hypothetical protein